MSIYMYAYNMCAYNIYILHIHREYIVYTYMYTYRKRGREKEKAHSSLKQKYEERCISIEIKLEYMKEKKMS